MVEAAWARLREALVLLGPEATLAEVAGEVAAIDRDLAAFVAANPGALEARLTAGLAELVGATMADPSDGRATSQLAILLRIHPPRATATPGRRRLDATLRAVDPAAMLVIIDRARRDHHLPLAVTARGVVDLAAYFGERAGEAALASAPIAPQLRDHLAAHLHRRPLPDIVPRALHQLSPDDIEEHVTAYVGLPLDHVHTRLRGLVGTFLAPTDRLGEVIARDARTLFRLGVDRHELADRLDQALERNRGGRITVSPGYQEDPFHLHDIHAIHMRGSLDVTMTATNGKPFVVSDLLPVLIRRACFFEGEVRYRLDPTVVARTLGLGPTTGPLGRLWSRVRGR